MGNRLSLVTAIFLFTFTAITHTCSATISDTSAYQTSEINTEEVNSRVTPASKFIQTCMDYVVVLCQGLAMLVISIGIFKAVLIYIKDVIFGEKAGQAIQESRLELGHSFSLGLGFLIGASILHTTVAPTWNDIGHLAAIIGIRTILNHFLLRDIHKNTVKCETEADEKKLQLTLSPTFPFIRIDRSQ